MPRSASRRSRNTLECFDALSPHHGVRFLVENGWLGYIVLGSVFLVVTGDEALYADMGHFGPTPFRIAWFVLVFPALLANYYGQGAMLLSNPSASAAPFFLFAPRWLLVPLVALATSAAIVASQAVISPFR